MIDPRWVLQDLDPRTWRAIGRFFMPGQYIAAAQPGQRGLFILHDGGRRPRVLDTTSGPRGDLGIVSIDDPRGLAQALHARGEWDRVHVIDKRHLAHVGRTAQASPRRELTLDAYYNLVYNLVWDGSDGYVALPPHPGNWHGWTFGGVRAFVAGLRSPSALGLCVIDDATIEIGLIVQVNAGRITRITTLEGLPALSRSGSITKHYLDELWSVMSAEIAPPAAVLVCTPDAFEAWLAAPDKAASLDEAVRAGAAVVRTS